jgi:hypothetical protein
MRRRLYSITSSAVASSDVGLEVNHQLELDWRLDGKLARFRALEDAVGVQRRTSVLIDDIRAVRDQAAAFSK